MNDLESLIAQAIQIVSRIQNQLPPETIQQLTSFFTQINEYLKNQNIEPPPELPQAQFPSSNVEGYAYDPDKQQMQIQFHGPYPNAKGPIYSYSNVPPVVFDILQMGGIAPHTSGKNAYNEWFRGVTPSHGAVVQHLVKAGGYPYQRVA